MTANGRGTLRTGGRAPPFLAIGLFVALVILGFNYWSLSARNGEQANEISLMESELRLVNAKKTSAEKRSEAISDKVNDLEKQLNEQREAYANKVAELSNVEKEKETFANRVNEMEMDLNKLRNEIVPKCEQDKKDMETQIQGLKENVEFHKNKPCDDSSCQSHMQHARDKTIEDIYKAAGAAPLISLYKAGGNLGSYSEQISQLAAKVENQHLGDGNVVQKQQTQNIPAQGGQAGDQNQPAPVHDQKPETQGQPQNPQEDIKAQSGNQARGELEASKGGDSNIRLNGQDGEYGDEGTEGQKYGEGQEDKGEGQKDDENYDHNIPDEMGKQYDNDDDDKTADDTLKVNDERNEEKAKDLDKEEDGIDTMFEQNRNA